MESAPESSYMLIIVLCMRLNCQAPGNGTGNGNGDGNGKVNGT